MLIEAATRLFLRDGFRATSLEAIGEEAGFSRGAVYSNFESKADIGIAVVDRLYEKQLHDSLEAIAGAQGGPHGWLKAWAHSLRDSIGDPSWARLEIELFSSGDGRAFPSAAKRYTALRSACEQMLLDLSRDQDLQVPWAEHEHSVVSLALVSTVLGFGMQRACDPAIPASAIEPILRLMMSDAV